MIRSCTPPRLQETPSRSLNKASWGASWRSDWRSRVKPLSSDDHFAVDGDPVQASVHPVPPLEPDRAGRPTATRLSRSWRGLALQPGKQRRRVQGFYRSIFKALATRTHRSSVRSRTPAGPQVQYAQPRPTATTGALLMEQPPCPDRGLSRHPSQRALETDPPSRCAFDIPGCPPEKNPWSTMNYDNRFFVARCRRMGRDAARSLRNTKPPWCRHRCRTCTP